MTPDLIAAAQARLSGKTIRTPLLESPILNKQAGRRVLVKAECLQHTGSFKYRGAKNAVLALQESQEISGVLAYSSGNHAQGIARAAFESRLPAVIVMPSDAPAAKVAGTRAYGAEIVAYDRWAESREDIGARLAEERNLTLIRPYDEPLVIAGQATTGTEISEQAAQAGVNSADVFVCCGGGGLSAGVALALENTAPALRVRTAEPENFDDMARSLRQGKICANAPGNQSICDAIVTPQPGNLTFPILSRLAGPGLAVSDQECLQAMALALSYLKICVEPGGAAALAAAIFHPDQLAGDTVIAIATGGNFDPDMLAQAIPYLPK